MPHSRKQSGRSTPDRRKQTQSAIPKRSMRRRLPLWKKMLFAAVSVVLFFGALEVLLFLCGVRPSFADEDPYVGFSSYAPLFVEAGASGGPAEMVTAKNKLEWFNKQRFPSEKPGNTYRIFCVGGSTTYGRPYNDATSFCGWLRELLPAADPSRKWEVINAGGISYASYRVALLMEELSEYDPDLIIIYTGHNEFLEHRTYRRIIDTPAPLRGLGSLLSRTRTHAIFERIISYDSQRRDSSAQSVSTLSAEVEALLDNSVGPSAYSRDDEARDRVIEHYGFSLARMLDIANSAGSQAIVVIPGSNMRDCSPFKSEHRNDLDSAARDRFETLYNGAKRAFQSASHKDALIAIDEAISIDPRYADVHYLRGKAFEGLGRYREAKAAYQRAIEEDVCPLRAVALIGNKARTVAAERDVPTVDFDVLVASEAEHGIPGANDFLDHVHPTIDNHLQLALAIVATMVEHGHVGPQPQWQDETKRSALVARVRRRVDSGIDRKAHGVALRNLSKVLSWAGKFEDAYGAAGRAVRLAPDDAEAQFQLGLCAGQLGRPGEAIEHYQEAVRIDPDYVEAHVNRGNTLKRLGRPQEALAHYEQALRTKPDFAEAHYNWGNALEAVGRPQEAAKHYQQALQIKPDSAETHNNLAWLRATCHEESIRDGEQAVAHATRAVELAGDDNPAILDSLSAAYAEAGDFEKAVNWQEKAVTLAPAQQRDELQIRLDLYRQGKPYRETP